MECLTRSALADDVTKTDMIFTVYNGTYKDDGKPKPSTKSWAQPVRELKHLLKKRCNLKWALVFCPYRLTDGLKEFSSGGEHKGW